MQKRLTLLRHAKSSWSDDQVPDRERPLNQRGERDAPEMGRRLAANGARPSLILTSPAKRARQTARLFARAIGYPLEFLQREDELYLAAPETILDVVRRQDDSFNDMVLVAHNPGIEELAARMSQGQVRRMPTAAMISVVCDIGGWRELDPDAVLLEHHDFPKRET